MPLSHKIRHADQFFAENSTLRKSIEVLKQPPRWKVQTTRRHGQRCSTQKYAAKAEKLFGWDQEMHGELIKEAGKSFKHVHSNQPIQWQTTVWQWSIIAQNNVKIKTISINCILTLTSLPLPWLCKMKGSRKWKLIWMAHLIRGVYGLTFYWWFLLQMTLYYCDPIGSLSYLMQRLHPECWKWMIKVMLILVNELVNKRPSHDHIAMYHLQHLVGARVITLKLSSSAESM